MQALIANFVPVVSQRGSDQTSAFAYRAVIAIGDVFDAVSTRVHNWQATREAIRELHRLNDHLLRDIGIERHEIESVVRRRARRLAEQALRPDAAKAETSNRVQAGSAANDATWSAAA